MILALADSSRRKQSQRTRLTSSKLRRQRDETPRNPVVTRQSTDILGISCPAAPRSVLDASFGAYGAGDSHCTGACGGSALADAPSVRACRAVLPDLAAAELRTSWPTHRTEMDQSACRRAGHTRACGLHRSADNAPCVPLPTSKRAIRDWHIDLPLGGCWSSGGLHR